MLPTKDHVIDGVRCAVYDSDPGRRAAVVFVHGKPGPTGDWVGLIPAVTPLFRAVAMDMPGYIAGREPALVDHCRRVASIPCKRGAAVPEIRYLEKDQV